MTLHRVMFFRSGGTLVLCALLISLICCKQTGGRKTSDNANATPAADVQTGSAAAERQSDQSPNSGSAATTERGAADRQSDEDKTVLAVSKAIRKNHLTDLEDECLAYQFSDSDKDYNVVEVREKVTQGTSMADTLAAYPKIFPDLYVNMVRSGEAAGNLDAVLLRLADFMDTDQGSPAGEFRELAD